MTVRLRPLSLLLAVLFIAAACGSGGESGESSGAAGLRLITADDGAAMLEDPPDDLIILDVRTIEEFGEGHLEGAEMLDFYGADFAEQLDLLDKDQPYLIYCRSGNRSGQTLAIMEELGFTDVADVDGGVLAWADAGLDLVTP